MLMNRSPKALTKKIIDRIEGDLCCMEQEHKEKILRILTYDIQKIIHDAGCGFKVKAYFDGGATPNPGQMKIGGYIEDTDKTLIYEYSEDIGYGTNNKAEYTSLLYLCKALVDHEVCNVRIHGDSSLIVNQVNGVYKAKDPTMISLRDQVRDVLNRIEKWELVHIPRGQNKKADALT
jgi:ribonuclease HI